MIEYYIDGSTKEKKIGAGIVKVNEFGFIEKLHFIVEHINPSAIIAEGYSLEKALEKIKEDDIDKNELIDIYTDNQQLHNIFLYNQNIEFNRSTFFVKQEANYYLQHIRSLYIELISKSAKYPIYYCNKTNQARPLIKLYYQDDVEDKKFLQEAHTLSRKYIKEEKAKPLKVELKAIRKENKWYIVKDNNEVVAENKRPLIALSDALKQTDVGTRQIKLCNQLEAILKGTNKNKPTSEPMKSALKIIENHKLLINF